MVFIPPNWADQIRDIAVLFMNAQVQFFDVTVNPAMGGVAVETIIWSGKARVEDIRSPREGASDYQADSVRHFRFQLDPQDNPPFFNQGTLARVLDGGRNPQLELLSYVVNSSTNSSHKAVQTVELSAQMESVNPQSFSGVVSDSVTGLALAGVEVRISTSGTLLQVFVTDGTGVFKMFGNPTKTYTADVSKTGHVSQTVTPISVGDKLAISLVAQ